MRFRTIIATAGIVEKIRTLFAFVCGSGGEGMFTTELSQIGGDNTTTHYISSGNIDNDALIDALPIMQKNEETGEYFVSGGYVQVVSDMTKNEDGIPLLSVSDIEEIFAWIEVFEEEAFWVMERIGLEIKKPLDNLL